MSKLDQIRTLREQRFAARETNSVKTKRIVSNVYNVDNDGTAANKVAMTNAERQAKWRAIHPELHRQRTRDAMRRLRANRRTSLASA